MQLNDFEHFGILFEDEEDNENAVGKCSSLECS